MSWFNPYSRRLIDKHLRKQRERENKLDDEQFEANQKTEDNTPRFGLLKDSVKLTKEKQIEESIIENSVSKFSFLKDSVDINKNKNKKQKIQDSGSSDITSILDKLRKASSSDTKESVSIGEKQLATFEETGNLDDDVDSDGMH